MKKGYLECRIEKAFSCDKVPEHVHFVLFPFNNLIMEPLCSFTLKG